MQPQSNPSFSQPPSPQFQQIVPCHSSPVSSILSSLSETYTSSIRKITQVATNLSYNAKHSSLPIPISLPFLNRPEICLLSSTSPAFMLGKCYRCREEEDNQNFLHDFHQIIWICYREEDGDQFGDVGWGCMIRVCQMVIAEGLKRCGNGSAKGKRHNSEIVKQFGIDNDSLFSFGRICMEGKILNRWTCSQEILIAMQELFRQQNRYSLRIQLFNIQVAKEDIGGEYPMLMVVSNRLGQKKIQDKMADHIKTILQHKNSIGLISAIGGEAIYIVGYHDNLFIALDPHYVQSEAEGQKKYFCQTPRGVPLQKIVSSVGFCFYFQNENQHRQWFYDFAESYHFHSPNIVIECDQQFCKKVYEQRHPKKDQSSDDQFQVL